MIGLEVSGYTLEEIAARDPAWITQARELIGSGRIEPMIRELGVTPIGMREIRDERRARVANAAR